MPEHSTDDVKVPGVRASVVVKIVRVVKQFQFLLKVMSQIHVDRKMEHAGTLLVRTHRASSKQACIKKTTHQDMILILLSHQHARRQEFANWSPVGGHCSIS